MEIDDQTLINRVVKQGNQRAFAELVKRYQSQLRYSLRQMTGWNEALADDLAQETFIKAYQALPGFRAEAKFSSWLYRIAYNQMVSHFRKAQNREEPSDVEVEDAGEHSEDGDLQRDLAAAMATLPEGQRMALHLFLHRECTHQEISDIMGIPLGTVKTHISRGREQLRHLLASWKLGETA